MPFMNSSERKKVRLIALKEEVLSLKKQEFAEPSIIEMLHRIMLERWQLGYRSRIDYLDALRTNY